MKLRAMSAALLVCVAASLTPAGARAQGDDAITKQARARFQEGVDHYDKAQFEAARASFLQAYALKRHPAVLLNLAQSSLRSGHPREALRYFQQYLREAQNIQPQQRRDAESGIAESNAKLGHIEVIAPPGTAVTVDGTERMGNTPLAEPVAVEPGTHTVQIGSDTVSVTVGEGQTEQARIGPAPATTPTPAPNATSTPPESGAPPEGATPPPANASDTATRTNIFAPPENLTPVWIGLGVGTAGLASAIVFAIAKGQAQDSADQVANDIRVAAEQRKRSATGICNDPSAQADFGAACALLQSNNDKVDTNATIANISLAVMAVGYVGAGAWYVFAPKAASDGKPGAAAVRSIQPFTTRQGGGLSISGAF